MTYDIRDLTADGSYEGSGRISPWAKRAPKAAALVNATKPDVIAVEEGATFVGHSNSERQVDSFRNAIGGSYRVAYTEIPPPQPHYFRTGDYIVYNSATFSPVGNGWHFSIGNSKWAVYDEFASVATGAKFLFVATHLVVGIGHSYDTTREAETKKIIATAGHIASQRGIPVIYAGDMNSPDPSVGAGKAMRAAGARDALAVAPVRTHGRYNSDNENLRTPPHNDVDIDHIYAPSGIKVLSAGVVLHLRHGQFVGVIPSDHNPVTAELGYPY